MPQPENDIPHLKAIPIRDVAERLGLLTGNGRQARCFRSRNHSHGDRRPSLHLNAAKNRFKCFVCPDTFGDVIDLVRLSLGIDFTAACAWLKSGTFEAPARTAGTCEKRRPGNRIYEAFYSLLDTGHSLLNLFSESRGIPPHVCMMHGTRVLAQYHTAQTTLERWFGKEHLIRSGLANDQGHLIFYRHRIIFPWQDEDGRPTYFTARPPRRGDEEAKELCLAGIAPSLPYNAGAVEGHSEIHLCEGVIDALTLEAMGLRSIALGGTQALRPSWVNWLKVKGITRVVLALDADRSGASTTKLAQRLFSEAGISVGRLFLPRGHDVNSYYGQGPVKKAA